MSLTSIGHWVAAFAGTKKGRMGRFAAAAALGLAACGAAGHATAGQLFTGQFGTGNTWNVYEGVNTPFTFKNALEFAAARENPITGNPTMGTLVALSSLEENNFVHSMSGGTDKWIGLTDRQGAAPGAMESAITADQATMGWAWVTGEPFSFQNWNPATPEPNNSNGEDAVHFTGVGLWNDNASGFGENDPPLTPPDPESTAEGQAAFGFVIEWRTNLAAMPTGFPTTRPDPPLPRIFPMPLERLPGPNGTATAWGTREVLGTGNSGSIQNALTLYLGGTGTPVDGTVSVFDVADLASNPEPVTGVIPGPSESFIGGGGDGFPVVTKGTISVPAGQGGPYTFSVRSDDGFALRILSQATPASPLTQHKFTAAQVGTVDEDGTLAFPAPTGDSNTRGVVNLPEGTYDVEFLMYEDTGGAFYEVASAKGDLVNGSGIARWFVLGDDTSLPGAGPFPQPVQLTGPANVRNYNDTVFGATTLIADIVFNERATPAPTPTAQGPVDDVVLNGDGNLGIHGNTLPAGFVHQFPNGTAIDMFSTAADGEFTVLDTDGAAGETLTFGLFADDNAAFHILGQSFTAVGGNVNAMLGNPEGLTDQWVVADFRTGNTDAYGLITLAEGTYDFEAFMLEEGGGAALEVWAAAGDHTTDGFGSGAFFPLTTQTMPDAFLEPGQGLARVAGPGTGPVAGPGLTGDFNDNGTVDAADYVLWRNGGPLANDPTDGVQPADYDVWRANFGRTAGAGAANAAGVPEAATLLSGAVALLLGFVRTRARRS